VMELIPLRELLPLLLRPALAPAEVADRGDEVLRSSVRAKSMRPPQPKG
jgi:hypothetical protein